MLIFVLNGPALPPVLWQATWSAEHTWVEDVAYLWASTADPAYQLTIAVLPPIIGQVEQLPPAEPEAAIQDATVAPPIDVTIFAGLPQAQGELPPGEIDAAGQETAITVWPPPDVATLGHAEPWAELPAPDAEAAQEAGAVWPAPDLVTVLVGLPQALGDLPAAEVEAANQEAFALAAPADVTTLGRSDAWWELPTVGLEAEAGFQETAPVQVTGPSLVTFLTQVGSVVETALLGQGTIRSKPRDTGFVATATVFGGSTGPGGYARSLTALDYDAGRDFLIQRQGIASTAAVGKGGMILAVQQPYDKFEDWLILNNFDFLQAELDHEHALGGATR